MLLALIIPTVTDFPPCRCTIIRAAVPKQQQIQVLQPAGHHRVEHTPVPAQPDGLQRLGRAACGPCVCGKAGMVYV